MNTEETLPGLNASPPPVTETDPAPTAMVEGQVEPPQAAFGAPRHVRRRPAPLRGCVHVLPDQASARLGMLSYLVPEDLEVRPGDAVRIPLGKREVHGMVVGPGDPALGTREILEVFGVRSDPSDISLAMTVARYHFSDPQNVLSRLSPSSGRGADPQEDAPVAVIDHPALPKLPAGLAESRRALLVRAPGIDAAALAAAAARDLAESSDGQVLVLCPTQDLVSQVLAKFATGAARVDSKAPRGAWKGLCEGTVRVAIGTRTAALYAAANLAGIVVVDEEHPGHIEQTQPHTHARDLASSRSRSLRVPLRLISLVPTPQAFGAAADVFAVGDAGAWPRMALVDRTQLDLRERLLPGRLKAALTNAAKAGKDPVVLAHHRAAIRRCVRCGAERPCTDCNSSLCRHAETEPCPNCQCQDGVKMRGWDRERLDEVFGGRARVVTLSELSAVRDAGMVVLFDLDSLIGAPDLIPGRYAAGVIATAAEAAGDGGTVVGMTDNPHDPLLDVLFGPRDMVKVARRFYAHAKTAGLPPFGRLVTVRVQRVRAPKTAGWPGRIHGPRQVGNEWELLVRVPNEKLAKLAPHLAKLRRGGKCKIRVE